MRLYELLNDPRLSYNDTLNPKIWNDNILKQEVTERLMLITNKFIETLELPEGSVDDIIFTGSNANYNWTKYSDVDVHVILNCSDCAGNESCLQAKKTLWNDRHDIEIYGFPVEMYATAEVEEIVKGSGSYSLLTNSWITLPKKESITIDNAQVLAKANEIALQIDQIVDSKTDSLEVIDELTDKIWRMRQAGLQKSGEFSNENLTFKALRNNGYLDKIKNYSARTQDNEMSLK